jgi:hypothetical protein
MWHHRKERLAGEGGGNRGGRLARRAASANHRGISRSRNEEGITPFPNIFYEGVTQSWVPRATHREGKTWRQTGNWRWPGWPNGKALEAQ